MRVYFVRHGQTDWNAEGRFQGLEDIPLNEAGHGQIKKTALWLKDTQLDAAYSSPLSRASDTAAAILEYHPGLALALEPLLIENNLGLVTGMLPEEREAFYATGKPTLAETEESSVRRITKAVRNAYRIHPGKNVLMVSHGGLINRLIRHLGITGVVLTNGCIVEMEYDENGFRYIGITQ